MSQTSSTGSRWSLLRARRAKAIIGGATLVVLVVLGLFAVQLNASQSGLHDRAVSRFRDRAQVISALTQAILSSAAAAPQAQQRYGAPKVSPTVLDQATKQGRLAYTVLLDERGRIISASRSLTPGQRAAVLSSPAVMSARTGAPVALGDVEAGTIDLAVSLNTDAGRRVLVSGAPTALFGPFLSSYLRRVPTRDGTAYVLDSRSTIIGARSAAEPVGRTVGEQGLAAAVKDGNDGAYGDDSYFVAVAVPGSSWRVVMTSTQDALFSANSGARKWLPWIILAALGLTALAFLALLRRTMADNDQLTDSNTHLQSTNALLRHAAELSRSNAELEQFASIASHDLQEPLRKVQTFAAQLNATESDRLSEQGQDFLRRMSDAAGRMRALIDDLLMFSRVSTKARPFTAVDLSETVAYVLADLEIAVEESGAQLTIEELPTIEAEPMQMRQLLQNLLGNALKFQRVGGDGVSVTPEITVRATVADGIAELTVTDNGLGFDAQFATRIFRAFERLHGTSAYPGTGIGLALCRKIVERHHGTITADGHENEGATFTVRLPLQQPDVADAPPSSLFPESASEEVPHALA
ncbi:MAG TPA: ATP-binding protein [Baekduia sp.]|nr:ATP-binding protein [Baekduia sp.]